ncbi:MAG: SpoIIE family protein phosphatase [Leptonema sp. (in: bacteria)]
MKIKIKKVLLKFEAIIKKLFLGTSIQTRIKVFFLFSFLVIHIVLIEIFFYLNFISLGLEKTKMIIYGISLIIFILNLLHLKFFLKFSIERPISEIISGIEKVNQGQFRIRLKVFSKDEFGKISSTFNRMLSSIRKKNRGLENYSKNLNLMIESQTQKIKEMLQEIKTIKEMQDADYYLTSLLVEQLEKKDFEISSCKVEFLIKQKKEFQFKNKKGEVGGDLCISRKIFLKEEPYIFFLNADAMGKSIQGAVGALIIASVMESILERTLKAFIFKNYSPERWLKNSFMELKHIFDSFNNSMACTLILGLVDENTGAVYFINAEHPPMILYRNSLARYVFKDFHVERLGIQNKEDLVYIKVFRLKPDDILILGSDGKDDIKTSGNIQINPESILRLVEKTKGNLDSLYEEIRKMGEIIDDMSFLKIHYTPTIIKNDKQTKERKEIFINLLKQFNANQITIEEIIEFYQDNLDFFPAVKFILQEFIKLKDYKRMEIYAKKYFEINPSLYNILYLIFYSLWKQKKFTSAVEFGERCYLRNPTNVILLLQLAQCYFKINNFSRGEYLIEKALQIDPNNPRVKTFIQKLKF